MNTSYGISEETLEMIISAIKESPKVLEVILYGSRAKNTFRKGSDIDIAIKAPNLNFDEYLTICSKVEDLPVVYKFDITHYDKLSKESLIKAIDEEGIVLYNKMNSTP